MLEALRDPFVQFVVGALLTIATLIVGLIGLRAYRTRKRLSYKIVLHERLLSVQQDMDGRVEIKFDDRPVHDVQMLVLHLLNTGNVAIEEADYAHPLGFSFGTEAKLLSVEVTEKKPANMEVALEMNASDFVIRPDVFNSGDGLELKVLLTGSAQFSPEGRVKGVSEIERIRQKDTNMLWFMSVIFAGPVLLAFVVYIARILGLFDFNEIFGENLGLVLLFLPALLGFYVIIREQRSWRRL